MAITRTPKGTGSFQDASQATGSLTIPSVAIDSNATVVVAVSMQDALNYLSSVLWNGNALTAIARYYNSGVHTEIWKVDRPATGTGNVVITCGAGYPKALAACVTQLTGLRSGNTWEQSSANANWGTTADSGTTGTSLQPVEICIAAIGLRGPSGDPAGGWTIPFTAGQRLGTTLATDTDNVTLQEGCYVTSATGAFKGEITGLTGRWFTGVIALLVGDAGATLTKDLADSLTLSDAESSFSGKVLSLSDSLGLSEDSARGFGSSLDLADTLTLSDSLARGLELSLSDVLSLNDQRQVTPLPEQEWIPVFPIPPRGERVLTHGYLTNVIGPAEDGHEQRVQLRRIPVHGIEFDWKDGGTREAQLLASLLYRQEQRWVVPYWPGMTRTVREFDSEDTKIYLPIGFWATSLWALWATEAAAGALYVVAWRTAWDCVAMPYTGHGSDGDGEYVSIVPSAGFGGREGTVILPATLGYLVGETPRDRLGYRLKTGRVALRSLGVV